MGLSRSFAEPLITGASTGIGKAAALALIKAGYSVVGECKGTLRTTGAVCVYVSGLQMEIILLATMSSARACSN